LGVVGDNGGRPYANARLRTADLIFYVGCKTDSVTTEHWTLPARSTDQVILHLDVDPVEVGRNYRTEVGLVGDARLGLADLLAVVLAGSAGDPRLSGVLTGSVGDLGPSGRVEVEAFWSDFEAKAAARTRPVKPQAVIRALARPGGMLPAGSIVIADAGTPTPFVAAYLRSEAGRQVIIPRGYGGLGYAIPGVVGAKLACPEATVIGLMGDGSFGMSAGELETLGRLGLPLTIIQFNNGCFGWIKVLQELYRDGRYFGVDFSSIDYAGIARGFGLMGLRVEDPQDLEPALHAALACGGPAFVDVVTESEIEELPPVAKWQKARQEEAAHA
jgi:acetolactate synthase-1/2/3 large subunit